MFISDQPYLGEFWIPGDETEKKYKGYLLYKENSYTITIEFETQFLRTFLWECLMGYIKNQNLYVRLINCIFIRCTNYQYTFEIKELHYSHSVINNEFNSASFDIKSLTYFFEDLMYDMKFSNKILSNTIKSKKPKTILLYKDKDVSYKLVRQWRSSQNKISASLEEYQEIKIKYSSTQNLAVIFKDVEIARNFVSLLSYDNYIFSNLKFENKKETLYCITSGYLNDSNSVLNIFPSLLFKDIENNLENIFSTLRKSTALLQIISLNKQSARSLNFIDRFLNFSRAVELFSSVFLCFDDKMNFISTTEEDLFYEWSEIKKERAGKIGKAYVYFKAFQYLNDLEFYNQYMGNKNFFIHMLNTRNYYTHLDYKKEFTWNSKEINDVNPFMKLFSFLLIWKFLGANTFILNKIFSSYRTFITEGSLEQNSNSVYFKYD